MFPSGHSLKWLEIACLVGIIAQPEEEVGILDAKGFQLYSFPIDQDTINLSPRVVIVAGWFQANIKRRTTPLSMSINGRLLA